MHNYIHSVVLLSFHQPGAIFSLITASTEVLVNIPYRGQTERKPLVQSIAKRIHIEKFMSQNGLKKIDNTLNMKSSVCAETHLVINYAGTNNNLVKRVQFGPGLQYII